MDETILPLCVECIHDLSYRLSIKSINIGPDSLQTDWASDINVSLFPLCSLFPQNHICVKPDI